MLATPALDILEARKEAGLGDVARSALMASALAGGVHGAQVPQATPLGRDIARGVAQTVNPVEQKVMSSLPPVSWHGSLGPLASGDLRIGYPHDLFHAQGKLGPYGAALEINKGDAGIGLMHPALRALARMTGHQDFGRPGGPEGRISRDGIVEGQIPFQPR